ncbi:hypothetical protein FVEG_10715 [Fusarium verticillioides 7600]|uniref:Uncharacterized protein n=1 Tax=Gibberella moniliformis (strain M3125 / FGSC 7600) TaxID=334819 RepID=W7MVK6_GIBM7|nr:hypothetical protein FVEG_10715 [Fusarium verticillioides 7600]EWG51849.1 hypothetical protein FVEG_10715 [Fusarium verticillioides 7600]RBQ87774.1 hypothetical protein FVER53263_10715 [Fusarium verticillioides]
MAVIVGLSRRLRECGRQGVLPWTPFWVSNKPFGTPLGPYFTTWAIAALMILVIPSVDAFNYATWVSIRVRLSILPWPWGSTLCAGARKRANLPAPEFKAWHVLVVFNIPVQLFVIIIPWYPPEGGMYAVDVSFWYATYVVTGIGILISCGVYCYFWAFLLPKWKGYRL